MSRSWLDINQSCRPFTVEPRSATSGRTPAPIRFPSTVSNGWVSSKRKRQDDEDWLLKHQGRLSFREHKAKEKLLDRQARSEIARLNPIIIGDEKDDSHATQALTLATPSSGSAPESEAPLVIVDLESDDEVDNKLPTLPVSWPRIQVEQFVIPVNPRNTSVDADADSPHGENGRLYGTSSEYFSLLEDNLKPRQPTGSASGLVPLAHVPIVLQEPSTGAWKNKVSYADRSESSYYPKEHTQEAFRANGMGQVVPADAVRCHTDLAGVL